jgi:hypothetical protein
MAKKTKQAKSAIPYVQRLAEDDYVQAQLRNAMGRLREAYGRAMRKRGRAAEDKKFYANLREAATSIRKAASRAQRKPKHRARKVAFAVAAGGAAVLLSRRRKAKSDPMADGAFAMGTTSGSDSGGAYQETLTAEAGGSAAN